MYEELLDSLFEEIKHGDQEHQDWLKAKISVFKDNLRESTRLTFSEALHYLRYGRLITREGWNGKNMHLYLENHFSVLVGKGTGLEHTRQYEPVIVMFTAQGKHQPGWLASQADLLATDWIVK